MSDHFITNITGVPTTGQYGPDGKPLNVNNDGGIEVTPQDAGNVPSAGTESRISRDNDKILSGNPYNQDASSTDAQAIGPSSGNPNMGNKYKSESQRLINSQFRNDSRSFPLDRPYNMGSYDHYKNESPSGSIDPLYESTFNIQGGSINESGEFVGATYVDNDFNPIKDPITITTSVGGAVYTSLLEKPDANQPTSQVPGFLCSKTSPPLIDEICEIDWCTSVQSSILLGKKMRIFEGQGCKKSGYWVQYLNRDFDITDQEASDVAIDCDKFRTSNDRTFGRIGTKPSIPNCGDRSVGESYCRKNIAQSGAIAPDTFNRGYTYGHRLMFVGNSLAGIKNKEWCAYETDSRRSPINTDPLTVDPSGHDEWFYEGGRCNQDGSRNDTAHSGKLYGCCCKGGHDDRQAEGYSITYVGDLTLGTSDDPCDCRRRKERGAKFIPEWTAAKNCEDKWVTVLMTGCNQAAASDNASVNDDALYCLATGRFVTPTWSETECAWYHDLQRVVRCDGEDPDVVADPDNPSRAILINRYCPSGSVITTITDRNLFPTSTSTSNLPGSIDIEKKINYAYCCSGNPCEPACVITSGLFKLGDYVNLSGSYITGMRHTSAAYWTHPQEYNLSASGASNGSGFEPDVVVSGASGCSYLTNSWKVVGKEYGNNHSSPDSLDCTWGYQIEFTGATPCSGSTPFVCAATGLAPNFGPFELYMPEAQLTSGAVSTGDADCSVACSMPTPLFEVGEYVTLATIPLGSGATNYASVSGYQNVYGYWEDPFLIDFGASGNGRNHTSTVPFNTGCEGALGTQCTWMFAYTGGIDPPPTTGIGEWQLSSSGSCCDCYASLPKSGLQSNGTYIWEDYGVVTIDCGVVHCNVITGVYNDGTVYPYGGNWKVVARESGDQRSSPDSLDCTWGYQVSFTGCPAPSSVCVITGFGPASTIDWIPEMYFNSGLDCNGATGTG